MRISDRIAELLLENDVSKVFMVTGGGSMHLNDALSRNKNLEIINMHHEQACTMAAEGYAKLSNKTACVNVTTGPGGINAINGVFGAWTDSVPIIVISGQVKRETLNYKNSDLRQLGDQENDITGMVKGITKFSYILKNPDLVDNILDYSIKLAKSGRPGPVWIDVPIDIQGATYNNKKQKQIFKFNEEKIKLKDKKLINLLVDKLNKAKRPAIIAGGGIRASKSYDQFLEFVDNTSIPVLTAWGAHDLLEDSHKNYCGRPGTVGDRSGNFIVQNCDLLLVLGSRLNIRQIGYNFNEFSPNSFKVMVDIDNNEMNKRTLNIDLKINTDLKEFFSEIKPSLKQINNIKHESYLEWCKNLKESYPVFRNEFEKSKLVNPYNFVNKLFSTLNEKDVVVTSDGTAVVTTFQGAKIKKNQRLFSNSGSASMGYGLPAAIGACISNNRKMTVCIEGDGSLQQNIQELATIKYHKLPLKLFVLSNDGYHSIRQTQTNYFPDNIVGCGLESGLYFPDLQLIAKSYNLDYILIEKSSDLITGLKKAFKDDKALIIEIKIDKSQSFEPKASSKIYKNGVMKSAPLHDLAPFLDHAEIESIINFEN